jgi:hypothetical protein
MAEVMRNGVLVLVPRKISDHIPTVPIHSTDRFVAFEINENLGEAVAGKLHYKPEYLGSMVIFLDMHKNLKFAWKKSFISERRIYLYSIDLKRINIMWGEINT